MTDAIVIKKRNMWLQILIFIGTFGFYYFYWFYQTFKELNSLAQFKKDSPLLYTILLIVPFLGLFSFYQYSVLYSEVGNTKLGKWITFLFWLFIPIAVWLIVQSDLNKMAQQQNS